MKLACWAQRPDGRGLGRLAELVGRKRWHWGSDGPLLRELKSESGWGLRVVRVLKGPDVVLK